MIPGVAIDWVNKNLYFIDSGKRTVEATNLGGKVRIVLAVNHIERPLAIAVSPAAGY